MKPRMAEAEISYNGKAITTALYDYFLSLTYTDPAEGGSDTLSVQLGDRDALWSNAWMPHKGDLIQAVIRVHDWLAEEDSRELNCGKFTLDELSFSGWAATARLDAVSAPVNSEFQCRDRSKTWEKITVKKIANDIAYTAGLALVYDAPEITLDAVEQKDQTDAALLQSLCDDYGLCLKIFAQKLVIFDRTSYKKKDAVATIRAEDLLSYGYRTAIMGSYTGGSITYTNPKTEKDVKFEAGSGQRILKVSVKADSKADAERKLNAALEKANHQITTLKIKTMGNPSIVSGQTVNVVGLGKLSGKYFVDEVTHTVSANGYVTSYALALVDARGQAAVEDAIDRLVSVGVINTPDYWKTHYKDVQYLDELLLNLSVRIQEIRAGTGITDVTAALTVLVAHGVINSPDYWQQNIGAIAYVDSLVIQAANALTGEML